MSDTPSTTGTSRPAVRVGVDVGGTFTKAVAFDLGTGKLVARSSVPTTHTAAVGPAAGVVQVVGDVARTIGVDRVALVTHSTTQAVNALLEADVATVGVLGLGRAPDLRKARARTRLEQVQLSPERKLSTASEFLDVTAGLDPVELGNALDRLVDAGATAICVAEAFAPDDGSLERQAVEAALARGLPACGSAEMTGLYGLELRTVTAALNASILPIALATAEHVEQGLHDVGVVAPVMVMRGDGGAIDATGFRREPARTLYSGPAASVSGVLRFARVPEGVLVEVGGTSTNVAAIRHGRPALSYVQVAGHATALRALDVRVAGVAGGSMLRARRGRLYGVGPRSAHIAGLPYVAYLDPAVLTGAGAEIVAPRPGDPTEYVVLRLTDGRHVALTNTCAALALEVIQRGDYASQDAHPESAALGFEAAGRLLRLPGPEVARRMLVAAAQAVGALVQAVAAEYELRSPMIIAVGGGAGGLGRFVASSLGLACEVPEGAEVISSIGDALSFVRVERERTVVEPTAADGKFLADDAQEACVIAGASAASVDVQVEFVPERSTLRAIATGSVGLETGALPGRSVIGIDEAATIAADHGLARPTPIGSFWIATRQGALPSTGSDDTVPTVNQEVLVLDRFGDLVSTGTGTALLLGPGADNNGLAHLIEQHTRRLGPITRAPEVWLVQGQRSVRVAPHDVAGARRSVRDDFGPAALVILRD